MAAGRTSCEKLVVGIDGGGTSTDCWLGRVVESGNVEPLAKCSGTGTNPLAVGVTESARRLEELITRAMHDGGTDRVAGLCIALAGSGDPSDRRRLLGELQPQRFADSVELTHDALAVIRSAAPSGTGIGLIAGTGSLCIGIDSEGRELRSGGAGPILGDEGSGYWLARMGLNAVVRELDERGPATKMTERFLSLLETDDRASLVGTVNREWADRDRLASLATVVSKAAEEGDSVASGLIGEAACELAALVSSVLRRMDPIDSPVPIGMAGGLLINSELLKSQVARELDAFAHAVQKPVLVPSPVVGALNVAASLC